MSEPVCRYCGQFASIVPGKEIYGRDYYDKDGGVRMFWWCVDCDAYVGCHPGSIRPLGTLANKELRKWRMDAHGVLDPLWESGRMSRKKAYRLAADRLGIHEKDVHVSQFDVEMCKKLINVLSMRVIRVETGVERE